VFSHGKPYCGAHSACTDEADLDSCSCTWAWMEMVNSVNRNTGFVALHHTMTFSGDDVGDSNVDVLSMRVVWELLRARGIPATLWQRELGLVGKLSQHVRRLPPARPAPCEGAVCPDAGSTVAQNIWTRF
jgi:hypothetical protein